MVLVELGAGGLLVHSPTSLGDDTESLVESCGTPRLLLAPNHFHHASLARFRRRWPEAKVIAAARAIPRLAAKGHTGLTPIDGSEPGSVAGVELGSVRFHVTAGTRTGETWVSVGDTLIVCDAFFNVPGPFRGAVGVLLRASRTGPGLRLGRTFRWLAVEDVKTYRRWAEAKLEELAPRRVLFSHGDALEGDDVALRLRELLGTNLG